MTASGPTTATPPSGIPDTDQKVRDYAQSKSERELQNLEEICRQWEITPLEVYNHFGIFAWSQKFLRGLATISKKVPDKPVAMGLLDESRMQRKGDKKPSNPKNWCIADVEKAVKSLGDKDSTSKSKSAKIPSKVHGRRTLQGIYTPPHTVNAGKVRTPAQLDKSIRTGCSVAATLFDIINSSSPSSHSDPATPTLAAVCLPRTPTPSRSSDPASRSAVSRTDQTPSQSARKRQRIEECDGATSNQHTVAAADHGPPVQRSVFHVDHQTRTADDELSSWTRSMAESIDALLQVLNPNPQISHVAPTRLVKTGRTSNNAQTIPESYARPNLILLPLYFVETAHWTLLVIRGQEGDHCDVFDTRGPPSSPGPSEALVALLEEQGFLRARQSANLDAFPYIHRCEQDANGAFLLAAVALHTLHKKPAEEITPGLWGELLRDFLSTQDGQSLFWWQNQCADIAKQTTSETGHDTVFNPEQKTKDAETLNDVLGRVRSYIKQSTCLRDMIASQLRNAEMNHKLEDLNSWYQSMPDEGVDDLLKKLVCRESEATKQRLGEIPRISVEGGLKLQSLVKQCDSVISDCEEILSTVTARRNAVVDMAWADLQKLGQTLLSLRV